MKYPGFQIWEVWADALLLPEDSAAWGAARHMYVHCFDGVRIMSKFEEFEKYPDRYQKYTIDKANRARSIGKKIMLCLDWHNTAANQDGYHRYRYIPDNLARQVEAIIKDVGPDMVQVANEPYYIKTGRNLRTDQYAAYVYEYVKGMKNAGFDGLMLAEQSRTDSGDLHDAWEWHVEDKHGWSNCAEGKHREPRVLHENKTAVGVLAGLNSNEWSRRNKPKGWHWPIFQDEFSSPGRGIHVNSEEGAKAMRLSLEFFKREKAPFAFLTMGGTSKTFGGEGGWGMHTQLVNSEGKVSLSGQEMLRFLGKPQYDGGEPPPPDKIDMLEIVAPKNAQFAKTTSSGGFMSTLRDDESLVFALVKGKRGDQWDWFYWDDDWIYHIITEDGAHDDPTAFKQHAAPGVKWCKRFATLGESAVSGPVIHRWANCIQGPTISLSQAKTTLHGKSYTAGGLGMSSDDVPGSTVCYRIDWRWGPSIEHLETFTYAENWGFLDWQHAGNPHVKSVNRRSPKPPVQPVFPCFNMGEWVDENMRPVDPPPPPPTGWYTIFTERAYLKFDGETAQIALDEINAGKNHLTITQVALEPAELAKVKAELTAIVGE